MNQSKPRIRLPTEVQAAIRVMHPTLKRRVRAGLDQILEDPQSGKPLKQELTGWRSFRVGRVRIIYRQTRTAIEVGAIGPRASIYLDAAQRLSRK